MTNEGTAVVKGPVMESKKKCSNPACQKFFPATSEYFSKNNAMPDKLDRWCKTCKSNAGKNRRLRLQKEAGRAAGHRGNGNGRRKERIKAQDTGDLKTGRVPAAIISKTPIPIEKSEDLYKKFRYTLAYEICDEVASHINGLKEKIAGELQLCRA